MFLINCSFLGRWRVYERINSRNIWRASFKSREDAQAFARSAKVT